MNILSRRTAKWYVYELADPRSGAVFYVGKGCGNRIRAHENEARKPGQVCSKKIRRIKDIWDAGLDVQRRHVAFFWNEQDAYDHETDLIEEIGLDNLTNVLPGGQKAWTERRERRAIERQRVPEPLHVVVKRMGAAAGRFAEWFKADGHKGVQWTFKEAEPGFKWHAAISNAAYNHLFPRLWADIQKDKLALKELAAVLMPHGVEFVHGSA